MNALLSLEPRVAGDAIAEPDPGFAEYQDELHEASNGFTGFCLPGTTSYYWHTTHCYA